MHTLALVRPQVRVPRSDAVEAVRWAGCLLAVGCAVAGAEWYLWWRPAPLVLAAVALAERWAGGLDRRTAARRAGLILLVAAGWLVMRNPPSWSMVGLWAGRGLTGGALVAVALDSLPAALRRLLARASAVLAANPGGRLAWLVALFAVAVPMGWYCHGFPKDRPPGDTLPVVPTVVRMLRHGDRDLSAYRPPCPAAYWRDYGPGLPYMLREGRDGRLYSGYPAGMEAFAWPAVLVAAAAGLDLDDSVVHARIESAAAAALAGATLGLFFLAALRVGPPGAAFAVTAAVGAGSSLTTTVGQALWQQGGVAFWITLALWAELAAGRWRTPVQGVACGLMLACRPSAVTFLLPFGLWVLLRDPRRGVLLPVIAALAYLPWAAVYWQQFGQILGPTAGQLAAGDAGRPNWAFAANLDGVLASPARGLLVYQPWALVLLVPAVRRGLPGGWHRFAAGFVALHVLLVGSWGMWWGGWCYGSRLVAELVPVLGLLAVRPTARLLAGGGAAAVVFLGLAGAFVHHAYERPEVRAWNERPANVDAAPGRLWDWAAPPFARP